MGAGEVVKRVYDRVRQVVAPPPVVLTERPDLNPSFGQLLEPAPVWEVVEVVP